VGPAGGAHAKSADAIAAAGQRRRRAEAEGRGKAGGAGGAVGVLLAPVPPAIESAELQLAATKKRKEATQLLQVRRDHL
jgi:hypothetical protein